MRNQNSLLSVRILLNPSLLFLIVWLIALSLYQLQLSKRFLELSPKTLFYLLTTCLSFFIGFIFFYFKSSKKIIYPKINYYLYEEWVKSKKVTKINYLMLFFFLIISTFEGFYFKNLPLLSIFEIGFPILYTEFGIPTLHGIANALFLGSINIFFIKYLFSKKKIYFLIIIIMLIWPLLLLTRQVFFSTLIQFFFIFILCFGHKIRIKMIFASLLILIFIFGITGNLRSGKENFLEVFSPKYSFLKEMPSSFLWIYFYIAGPITNIEQNIDIKPQYMPKNILYNIIPSIGKNLFTDAQSNWLITNRKIGKNEKIIITLAYNSINRNSCLIPRNIILTPSYHLNKCCDILNVSTFHKNYLSDFGIYFSQIIFFLIAIFFSIIMAASINKPNYGLGLVVILHGVILSFFTDLILSPVFMLEFFIFILINHKPISNAHPFNR